MLIRLVIKSHPSDSLLDHLTIFPRHTGTLPPLPIRMLERAGLSFKDRIVILAASVCHQDLWLCDDILQIQQTRVGTTFAVEPEGLHILGTLFGSVCFNDLFG